MQDKKQQLEPDMEQQTGSKLGKEYIKTVILSPCLFNLYAEYIIRNVGLEESQAGRNQDCQEKCQQPQICKWYCLMAEHEEEWKSLLMKVKEESEKAGLILTIQKMKVMASSPITSWQLEEEIVETITGFIFMGSRITADGDCSREIKMLALWNKSYDKPRQHIKSRDTTVLTKVHLVKANGFSQ